MIETSDEFYCIFYRTGQGFQHVVASKPSTTNLDTSGRVLNFHSAQTSSGGRKPGYALFETTDRVLPNTNALFTVICYHACFNSNLHLNRTGLLNLPRLAVIRSVAGSPMNSAIIGGDFNWDYIADGTYNQDYENALNSAAENLPGIPPADVRHKPDLRNDDAKSTIVVKSPPVAPSVQYRANAFDHIFARNVQNFSAPMNGNGIIDMIENFTTGTGALVACADRFNTSALPFGTNIPQNPTARTILDAWHIYRYGVSDHLPVIAGFQI